VVRGGAGAGRALGLDGALELAEAIGLDSAPGLGAARARPQ